MIQWVEDRLNDWGRYMSRAGYRSSSGWPYVKVHIRGTAPNNILISPDVMEIDEILSSVKSDKPKWHATAVNLYQYGLSAAITAGRMKCHIDTVYDRRDALHRHVAKQITVRVKT